MQIGSLTQKESDRLFCSLLEGLSGVRQELPKDTEHAWERLQSLPEEFAEFSLDVIREAAYILHRVGFLKSLEDRGDTFVCGGLTQLGAVRIRYYKAATRSYIAGTVVFLMSLVLIGLLYRYLYTLGIFHSAYTGDYTGYLGMMLVVVALRVYQHYYP